MRHTLALGVPEEDDRENHHFTMEMIIIKILMLKAKGITSGVSDFQHKITIHEYQNIIISRVVSQVNLSRQVPNYSNETPHH